jgi:hypothetical protein
VGDQRSIDDLDLERVLSSPGKQADDVIEAVTEWPELASELDLSRYRARDAYPEWHVETNEFDPVFLLYCGRKPKTSPSPGSQTAYRTTQR